jgi:hypothetical protein
MRRTVVDNPENHFGGTVRFPGHNVLDPAGKRRNSGFGFASTEQFCPPHIPCCQIAHRPFSRVFKFDILFLPLSCSKACAFSMSCLNACLFIGGDHKITRFQGKSIPYSLIKVQYLPAFCSNSPKGTCQPENFANRDGFHHGFYPYS